MIELVRTLADIPGPWKLAVALMAGILFTTLVDRKARH